MTLEVDALSVRAPGGASVLDRISLSVAPGECLAVVGESGAGKSVLARTLLGLTQEERRWRVDAERWTLDLAQSRDPEATQPGATTQLDLRGIRQRTWRGLRGDAIGLVLQDALQSLDPLRTIEAEVGESLAIRHVPRRERRGRVITALEDAGLPDPALLLSRRSEQLSGGMRQRALIASALIGDPALIIADEPTTALDPVNSTQVLNLFRRQCQAGRSLLLISHDLSAVAQIADRVAVLDHGRIVEAGPVREVLEHPRHATTQRLVAAIPSGTAPDRDAPHVPSAPAPPTITLRDASRTFSTSTGVRDITLDVHRGEALGLVGESGAGKTTLARLLVGADRPTSGEIRFAPGLRVRLIPQDPLSTFDPRWRVERIIASSLAERVPHTPATLLESVGLSPAFLSRRPATLSGGERQRVAIARALAAAPDVLVCDEPVSALDVATQAGVLGLLRNLQRQGVGIVFISHDFAAVRIMCDRVAVLNAGRIVATGPPASVLDQP